MKKRITAILVAMLCMVLLTGCFCQHETWNDATCDTPKTCADCGKTEGEALGHVWMAATCDTPKTCETCGATEGEAKGHDMVEATCEEAKHCTRCNLTEGEALGHTWLEATTETPQTCAVCAKTEGERIITDARFTTASTKDIQGVWTCQVPVDEEMLGIPGVSTTMDLIIDFQNDGTMAMSVMLSDEEAFMKTLVETYVEVMYAEFASYGMSREESDAAMTEEYGMGVQEYIESSFGEISFNDMLAAMFEEMGLGGVYYMEDGNLYSGLSWDGTMSEETYTLTGDTLVIDSINQEMGMDLTFTRK